MTRPRLIALGASNLTRFLPLLLRVAAANAKGPIDAFAALGMGRSYGVRSRLFWRELPGLQDCGLWPALVDANPADRSGTTGIITDVGNDVFYGVEPKTVLSWVDGALQRVRPLVDRLVVSGVPASVFDLGAARFELVRRVLVPSCKLELEQGKELAMTLHEGLRELAQRHGAVFLEFPKSWYGWDAIHVKRRHWRSLVEQLLGAPRAAALPRLSSARVRWAAPERRWLFRRERVTKQPAVQLRDGSSVSLF